MPILAVHEDFRSTLIEVLSNRSSYTDWGKKIFVLNKTILDEQRRLFNTSVMYFTQLDGADRLIRVQRKLRIRGYFIAQRDIDHRLLCFIVNEEFQFLERLNEIFHRIQSSGLYALWIRHDDIGRENLIVQKNLKRLKNEQNSTIRESESFPMFIVYGWIASGVLLLAEIIWFWGSKYIQIQNENNGQRRSYNCRYQRLQCIRRYFRSK